MLLVVLVLIIVAFFVIDVRKPSLSPVDESSKIKCDSSYDGLIQGVFDCRVLENDCVGNLCLLEVLDNINVCCGEGVVANCESLVNEAKEIRTRLSGCK
ncbi:hypothetical protein COU62_03000 [Candidatus Pacearchaeota archaeon CG10_big_fil_rev_8_21_14_0_10_35_219]|nr:hypothetical protein [Candidatus Pacearchaeota archaeon]OIO42625.1 MAG: hypothetical protein AUJ63_02450 [Candidatus Pacearchaeota archaeon CG1_02_35_32]PIO07594.1 MAG: hypothetical protein COU62_03000 [Candidatus Pacearchaeota archaeon CG10_big_fil_rev_8_21_14_0_10_35_219]PIY81931.1 MAG: hypothetical protein COY79_00155 [Candidatus Pacearchaeota archaeon CG_4_10_14_0_8_um_filter_35_169]PIZ80584.1 MAG: hypothetical protein COY00_00970 [Candidatus Pacearchaeota archaeon CG_4_10_14_0_2_um_filt